jgi:hypothetical protein
LKNTRLILACLLISFLFVYLEWGKDQSGFMFQMEYSIFMQNKNPLDAFSHPFVFIPLIGQLILLSALFREFPERRLTISGIVFLGVLVAMILFVGILSGNWKIILSTIPFIAFTTLCIIQLKKSR